MAGAEGDGGRGVDPQAVLKEIMKIQSELRKEISDDTRVLKLMKDLINGKVAEIVQKACSVTIECSRLQGVSEAADRMMGKIRRDVRALADQQKGLAEAVAEAAKPAPTYAEAAVNRPRMIKEGAKGQEAKQEKKHVVILQKENQTAAQSRLDFTDKVDPVRAKIKIKGIRQTKGNGLVTEVSSEKDIQTLREHQALQGYKMETPRRKNPLVILYDVDSTLTEEELVGALISQNFSGELSDTEVLVPRFKTGPRDKDTVHWVLEVSPAVRQKLLTQGRAYLTFASAKVKDFVKVAQCMKCSDYGHVAKYCTNEECCSRCQSKEHKKADCKEELCCIPCKRRNITCKAKKEEQCPTFKIFYITN